MGTAELLIDLALMIATLVSGSDSEGDGKEDTNTLNNDDSKNKNMDLDEVFAEEECIDAIKMCGEEKGQPCVCGALVQWTAAIDELEAVHMVKIADGKAVKVAGIEQLDETDIQREAEFSGCKYSARKDCILPIADNIIEGDVWQDIDQEVKVAPNSGALNVNWSYMICNYGQGLIYFKDSGQNFKNAIYKESDNIFGRENEFEDLSEDEILFVKVLYGEASACSSTSWEAIANVVMNRVGVYEWSKYKTPIEIIKYTGFNAYKKPNNPYREAEEYFENRDYSNLEIEKMIQIVLNSLSTNSRRNGEQIGKKKLFLL